MQAACTIVAKNCLALGRVVARSFTRHHPQIPFFILLADQPDNLLLPSSESLHFIPLDAIAHPETRALTFRYTQQEFSYAMTPALLLHLLRQGYERVLFIKQESLVLGDLSPEFDALRSASVLLTPHLLRPLQGEGAVDRELTILISGMYNGGFLGVSNRPEAIGLLEWWQDRLRFHCLHATDRGMHFEQRWLDFAPAFVRHLHVSRDPGLNVAHWNLPERHIENANGIVTANGLPCRLFRFSGYDYDHPRFLTRYFDRLHEGNLAPAALDVMRDYHRQLTAEGHQQVKGLLWAYDHFDNGVRIPAVARRLYANLAERATSFADPFQTQPEGSFFNWLAHRDPTTRITPLWSFVYDIRPDLQRAFPHARRHDHAAFAQWIADHGIREFDVPPELTNR